MTILRLPTEILQVIAGYITIQDISICQSICRSWYKKWISFIYNDVKITGKIQFQKFLHQTLQNSIYPPGNEFHTGNYIRKLVIEYGHIEPSNLGQLPLLCPYLEIFMFDGVILSDKSRKEKLHYYQQRQHQEEINKVQHHFSHWKHMRQMVEFNGITAIYSLLNIQHQLNYPSQLRNISIHFNNSNDRTNLKNCFIKLLVNVSLLESLSIGNVYLSITEVQKIHDYCPKLTSIHLMSVILLPVENQGYSIKDITPAWNMTKLHIVNNSLCEHISQWLEYISIKYINLKVLDIASCFFKPQENSDTTLSCISNDYQQHLLQIAANCRRLNVLKLINFTPSNLFFYTLDQKGTVLTDLTLGDGLNSMHELNILIQSRQLNCISSLTIDCSLLIKSGHSTLTIIQAISRCKNITTLHLSMGKCLSSSGSSNRNSDTSAFYFDSILKNFPKLVALYITNAKLLATTTTSITPHSCFYLQSFNLENVVFDSNNIFNLIRSTCLLLNTISLTATMPCSDDLSLDSCRQLNIYLPHHQLKQLILDRIRISKKCSIRLGTSRFKITNTLETTWYDLVEYGCGTMHLLSSVPQLSNVYSSPSSMERMRAKKVKITPHHRDCSSANDHLNQSVYVAVQCKQFQSIHLTGLQVL